MQMKRGTELYQTEMISDFSNLGISRMNQMKMPCFTGQSYESEPTGTLQNPNATEEEDAEFKSK